MEDGYVTFRWKNYAAANQTKAMKLDAVEFVRRFLLHILPSGFVRIRQFGFLANRARGKKLALCRALLGAAPVAPQSESSTDSEVRIEEQDRKTRPVCLVGRMIRLAIIPAPCAPKPFPRQAVVLRIRRSKVPCNRFDGFGMATPRSSTVYPDHRQ